MFFSILRFIAAACISAVPAAGAPLVLYVAPSGNDAWTGALAEPNAEGTDGPLATPIAARDTLRKAKAEGAAGPFGVFLRGGTYRITEALAFGPEDADTAWKAYPGETPVLSGGRVITGWRQVGDLWVADLPEVQSGAWRFSALWVNGERRTVARTPNDGEYYFTAGIAGPQLNPATGAEEALPKRAFKYAEGDLQPCENMEDVLIVAFHAWETSAHRIERLDEEKREVLLKLDAYWPFEQWGAKQRYHVENIFEGLDTPGEWYLNRKSGQIYYWPLSGEEIDAVETVAPAANQLVLVQGNAADGIPVQRLRFEGITFAHTEFGIGPEGHSDPQAAVSVNAAVQFQNAADCTVTDCTIAHTGGYGLWFAEGCARNRAFRNELHDLGAGAVRVGNAAAGAANAATRNSIENNFLHDGGHIFRSGVGVFISHANYTTVAHNEIADFFYSGVSNGWVWGYSENPTHHNIIEYNHIHDCGKGVLSDMGGIYSLGIQPGTVLQFNHIHDIYSFQYGGWGLYTDEGSSEILMQFNLVYNTTDGNFHQHYGQNNRVRNNIFAYSKHHQAVVTRDEPHRSIVFERNIVVSDNGRVFSENSPKADIWTDENLYWDSAGTPLVFGGLDFAGWQALGRDLRSLVADPLFEDAPNRDFRLKPESPAFDLGFQPFDVSAAGLYGPEAWTSRARPAPPAPETEAQEPPQEAAPAQDAVPE